MSFENCTKIVKISVFHGGVLKGQNFLMESIRKGYLFLSKMVNKRLGKKPQGD